MGENKIRVNGNTVTLERELLVGDFDDYVVNPNTKFEKIVRKYRKTIPYNIGNYQFLKGVGNKGIDLYSLSEKNLVLKGLPVNSKISFQQVYNDVYLKVTVGTTQTIFNRTGLKLEETTSPYIAIDVVFRGAGPVIQEKNLNTGETVFWNMEGFLI